MKIHRRLLLSVISCALGPWAPASDYTAPSGPFTVGTLEQVWHDQGREREVPVKIYFPLAAAGEKPTRFPVIIFSHGLGGSREGYAYLGEHWAGFGCVSVHLQHHGSDEALLKGFRPLKKLRAAANDPTVAIERPADVRFAIDRLAVLDADPASPLHDRLDLARIGVAGHSFGAVTTMAIAGAHLPVLNGDTRYPDARVKAAIAMSTPAFPGNDTDAAFDDIRIPVLHLTGTNDESPVSRRGDSDPIVGNTRAAERLRPFRHTRHAPAYLLVFEGGDHLVFSGRRNETRATDREFQSHILSASTAFWDAWLKDDPGARHWLEDGGFAAALGKLGTFEQNRPKRTDDGADGTIPHPDLSTGGRAE